MSIYFDKRNCNWVEGGNNYQYVATQKRKFILQILKTRKGWPLAEFKDMLGFDVSEITLRDLRIGWDPSTVAEFQNAPVIDHGDKVEIVLF